jgi:peptide deformylase
MATREILRLGNPLLYKKCEDVISFNSTELFDNITDLKDTLSDFQKENGFGRAIAAPQIGITKRIVYIDYKKENLSGPLINPRIVRKSREKIRVWDDCFSFPELMVNVERFRKIEVDFFNSSKEKISIRAEGDLSELLQHEIDHLDGREEWEKFLKDTYLGSA